MSLTILVTGPTGTIGSKVVALLAQRPDIQVRAGVRSPEKEGALRRDNITPVAFDYEKPETIAAAVRGVDKVCLITPFTENQVELGTRLVDAAKAAGVKHIVKLSALGCEHEPGIQLGRWHRAIEKHIEASGLAYTFLRPNNFMDNFIDHYPAPDGNLYLPWGQAACSFIDGRDLAAAAVGALTSSGHENKAYDLTGPEAVTIAQAAETLSQVSGKKISYVDVPEEAAKGAMLGVGLPAWMVSAVMELHYVDKMGYAAAVNDNVEKLTGKKPRSFADFARDNAAKWR
jgi:uncharacterized protein YbjT (DUF2867 family)